MTGVAVNVTELPAQIELPGLAAMLTSGVNSGLTVIVTALLVSLAALTHAALLAITQVIISPLASVPVVNVALLVPVLNPLSLH